MPKKYELAPIRLRRYYEARYPDYRVRAFDEHERTKRALPNWCYLNVNWATAAYGSHIQNAFRRIQRGDMSTGQSIEEIATEALGLHMISLWELSRVVYHFDSTLTDELVSQKMPSVPADILIRLPQYCVCIENVDIQNHETITIYCCVSPTKSVPAMLMVYVQSDNSKPFSFNCPLIQGKTISECIGIVLNNAKFSISERAYIEGYVQNVIVPLSRSVMNLLLYLVADNAEIDTQRKHVPHTPSPIKPDEDDTPDRPTVYDVGIRIGNSIRAARARIEQERAGDEEAETIECEPDEREKRRVHPMPHVRRAHYHTYRTGPGRRNIVVHWLSPILVGTRDDETLPITIYPVKPTET